MNNEIIKLSDQSPIEIALGIDENGRTTAKKLYSFLELNKSNYNRWVKKNIINNKFADENIDYWTLVSKDERKFNPNPTQDYKLTATFAKKLSMISKSEKGEEARCYFIKVEDILKDLVTSNKELHNNMQTTTQVSFNEVVQTLPVFADFLKVNDVSKLIMAEKLCESYNIPTNFLPDYIKGGDRESKPVTELLKLINLNISSIKFNQILLKNGYLEERKRVSRSSKSGFKLYKALTEKGLKYGENLINPNNPKETQPYYYVDTFEELYKSLSM